MALSTGLRVFCRFRVGSVAPNPDPVDFLWFRLLGSGFRTRLQFQEPQGSGQRDPRENTDQALPQRGMGSAGPPRLPPFQHKQTRVLLEPVTVCRSARNEGLPEISKHPTANDLNLSEGRSRNGTEFQAVLQLHY